MAAESNKLPSSSHRLERQGSSPVGIPRIASAASVESLSGTMPDGNGDEHDQEPYVINRQGQRETININQVSDRVRGLCALAYGDRLRGVDVLSLLQCVVPRIKSGITTREIDEILVEVCRSMTQMNSNYAELAARLMVSDLQKSIEKPFAEVYTSLYEKHGKSSRLSPGFIEMIRNDETARLIEEEIMYQRDFNNSAFSIASIMRSYLMRDPQTKQIVELPQHMYMRIALQLHCMQDTHDEFTDGVRVGDHVGSMPIADKALFNLRLEKAFETYKLLSLKKISHATPTVINACTTIPQMSSCFQTRVPDSLTGLYRVMHDTAMVSKTAGGVSIDITEMRAAGTLIKSSGGESSGIERYMQLLQQSQKYANQGGVRPGAFAIYLAAWHADVFTFLDLALPRGPRFEAREDACKLKYALWVSDRFFLALEQDITNHETIQSGGIVTPEDEEAAKWYLMSPDECPGLQDVFDERGPHHPDGPGGEFSKLYDRYVSEGKYREVVSPLVIIQKACIALGQRGYPYMLSKDNVNRQSNLVHQAQHTIEEVMAADFDGSKLAETNCTVKNSNLCAEVTIPCQYIEGRYRETLYSVCNLAAINLERFVVIDRCSPHGVCMDWAGIIEAAGILTNNLDNIIDINYTDIEACRRSNQHFRAIGIGIMGLADVFHRFGLAFGDEEAMKLDAAIHACIYFGAMHQSAQLARQRGSFPAFESSKAAQGILQPDMCVADGVLNDDWAKLIEETTDGALTADHWTDLGKLVAGGLRNGYVTADMPTATSSNAAGVNECFEPRTSQLYMRKTLAGEFTIINPQLQRELERMKLWNRRVAARLESDAGSVATWDGTNGAPKLTERMREVFLTAREVDPLVLIAHSASRNPFISQSQSLNAYRETISVSEILEIWLTGWLSGLGTLSYYVHTKPSVGSAKIGSVESKVPPTPPAGTVDIPPIGQPIFPGAESDVMVCPLRRPGEEGGDCTACSV